MPAPLARREFRARPGRFVWLTVAVTVAVGFTVGAFGFSARLSALLDPTTTTSGLDVLPAGSVVLTSSTDAITSATALDERLIDQVRAIDGVALAEGSYDQPVEFRLPSGHEPERPVVLRGVLLSSTYSPRRWTITDGREPRGPDEVALDAAGLVVSESSLGGRAQLEVPTGVREVSIVGIARSAVGPASGAGAGASGAIVSLASAHAILDPNVAPLLLDAVGRVDRITVLPVAGLDPGELERRLREALPPGVVVTSSLSRAATTQHTVQRIDDGVQRAVEGFAGLTILISSLVVTNTLSVLVAQRTREFGLLRMVGASRRQVLRIVLGESVMVGLIGADVGLGLGVVLADLAARAVRAPGMGLGESLTPAMPVVAVGVGVGVTVIGGMIPALRAGRVPPLAALSDTRGGADRPPRSTLPIAAVVVGGALAAVSATRADQVASVAGLLAVLGALTTFVGIAGLSRWVVRPLLSSVAAVVRAAAGPSGRLGVGNARRQPSRTAGAASTLMVGLALVAFVATLGASIRTTVRSQFVTTSHADFYLERRGVVRVSPAAVADDLGYRIRQRATYAALIAIDGVLVGRNGATASAEASDVGDLGRLVDFGISGGVARSDGAEPALLLSDGTAEALGVGVGDRVVLRSISGTETSLRVNATYSNTAIVGGAVVDATPALDRNTLGTFELGLIRIDAASDGRFQRGFDGRFGDPRRFGERAVESVANEFPKVRVHTPSSFGDLNASVTDTVLRVLGVVLVGMIGIGYLGLVATLGLSTLERRKELVMLRAVGAARSQLRAMVWIEATLVGFIAAVLGLGLGIVGGWAGARAAPADLAGVTVVPWDLLVLVGVVSMALAWIVSLGVARRASFVPPAEAGR